MRRATNTSLALVFVVAVLERHNLERALHDEAVQLIVALALAAVLVASTVDIARTWSAEGPTRKPASLATTYLSDALFVRLRRARLPALLAACCADGFLFGHALLTGSWRSIAEVVLGAGAGLFVGLFVSVAASGQPRALAAPWSRSVRSV